MAIAHSLRFRHMSSRYPHEVSMAYGGDIAAAMADDPETVATRVAEWERSLGKEPRDWAGFGRSEEGHQGYDPGPGEWIEKAREFRLRQE